MAICRATAFFICCIFFFRVLLFIFGGDTASLACSIAFAAAFLAFLAASLFGNTSGSLDDILLYKGRDNYSGCCP
jgi:hypothetical protein